HGEELLEAHLALHAREPDVRHSAVRKNAQQLVAIEPCPRFEQSCLRQWRRAKHPSFIVRRSPFTYEGREAVRDPPTRGARPSALSKWSSALASRRCGSASETAIDTRSSSRRAVPPNRT